MRAGPLSDPKVIDLLNAYFVCLYTSNDEIAGEPEFVKRESAERQKKILAFDRAGLGTGSVTVYVLTADAQPLRRLGVVSATEKEENLRNLLEKVAADLKLAKGPPLIKPGPQSEPPPASAGDLVLHLTARKLQPRYSWNEFPSENWIVLKAGETQGLLPEPMEPGAVRDIDGALAVRILTYFYPQTEVCTADETKLLSETGPYNHRLERQALRVKVLSNEKGSVRCRLEGSLRLHHDFYPDRPDPKAVVEATLLGYLDYDQATRKIGGLRLVTARAMYDKIPIGVALRSGPPFGAP